MLNVGTIKARECRGLTRRELLKVGSLGAIGLSLGELLKIEANANSSPARAKSVILLWLWGGPSHLDTFDLKPDAPQEYRGPYAPIHTSVSGIDICELLPQLAARAHQYTLIRSLHHTSNDHGIAGTINLTGSDSGAKSLGGITIVGQTRPTHGSIIARMQGLRPGMPPFATVGGHLHQGKKRIAGEGAATLGAQFDPFRLDYSAERGVQIPQLDLSDGVTPSGIESRRKLLEQLDHLSRRMELSPSTDKLDGFYQQAFSLLTSNDAHAAFDLDKETPALRNRYGRFRFGQCCLLARRLVEAGTRFVQVNWSSHVESIEDTGDGGWDMHDRNFQLMQDRYAWMLDQSVSALLDDLDQRGLLDSTMVVAIGEFGRTPKINNKSGRDHWNDCYSALVAGGGFRSGEVIGASNPRGEFPISQPVTPADLFTTVLTQLGIGTPQLTEMGLVPLGSVIESLTSL